MAKQIRCPQYPGWCPYTTDMCPNIHPSRDCPTNCSNKNCIYLHPICVYDSSQLICTDDSCTMMHPYRASHPEEHSRRLSEIEKEAKSLSRNAWNKKKPESNVNPSAVTSAKVEAVRQRVIRSGHPLEISAFFKRGNCMVCAKRLATQLFEPCNHLVLCKMCVKFSDNCILCFERIQKVLNYA